MNNTVETEERFWTLDLFDEHKIDLQKWINDDGLIALVDEESGGIIGYIGRDHISMIMKSLSKK